MKRFVLVALMLVAVPAGAQEKVVHFSSINGQTGQSAAYGSKELESLPFLFPLRGKRGDTLMERLGEGHLPVLEVLRCMGVSRARNHEKLVFAARSRER